MGRKVEDLTGKRFGNWTVIKRSSNKGTQVYWECQCDCGDICDVRNYSLIHSKSTMCIKCFKKKQFSTTKLIRKINEQKIIPNSNNIYLFSLSISQDLIYEETILNQEKIEDFDEFATFNSILEDWKIIGFYLNYISPKGAKQKRVVCRHICGYEKPVIYNSIKRGNIPICDKCNENMIGQVFGKLIVIEKCDYTKSGKKYWKCQCSCGKIIEVCGSSLRLGRTKRCKKCANAYSKGEEKIKKILLDNNIPFVEQKKFDDCRDKNPLPFDFYIENKYIVEYDGIQHFEETHFGEMKSEGSKEYLEKIKYHDSIKNIYCISNNIPIIRIPYTAYNDFTIEDLLLSSKYLINSKSNLHVA